jgi:hypothetical protein
MNEQTLKAKELVRQLNDVMSEDQINKWLGYHLFELQGRTPLQAIEEGDYNRVLEVARNLRRSR